MSKYRRTISGDQFGRALMDAGVLPDDGTVRRVVIDAEAGNALLVYVECYGDERFLSVVQTLQGVEISGVPAPTTQ